MLIYTISNVLGLFILCGLIITLICGYMGRRIINWFGRD